MPPGLGGEDLNTETFVDFLDFLLFFPLLLVGGFSAETAAGLLYTIRIFFVPFGSLWTGQEYSFLVSVSGTTAAVFPLETLKMRLYSELSYCYHLGLP